MASPGRARGGVTPVARVAAFLALAVLALVLVPTPAAAADPTAICRDGWQSYSATRSGTCSSHGGVAQWCPCGVPPTTVVDPRPPVTGGGPVGPVGCRFEQGFALLRDQVPAVVGRCLDNQAYSSNHDAVQHTTAWHGEGGLLVWRRVDNWTAFTDGATTWINGPFGVQSRPNAGPCFSWERC
jgi:hypothetical protein